MQKINCIQAKKATSTSQFVNPAIRRGPVPRPSPGAKIIFSGEPYAKLASHPQRYRTSNRFQVTKPVVLNEEKTGDKNVEYSKGPMSHTNPNLGDSPQISRKIDAALAILLDAWSLAERCNHSVWDFAVEISEFTDRDIGRNVLRLLAWQGQVEHRNETTGSGERVRSFQSQDMVISPRSCFVLTDAGRKALASRSTSNTDSDQPMNRRSESQKGDPLKPHWDENRRELKLGECVVKQFKWPASNQEKVILAFQEEGWPTKIDDPLPPSNDVCPKRRLHDTIKCLNRKQINPSIKFRGDGTGQGVVIEIIDKNVTR